MLVVLTSFKSTLIFFSTTGVAVAELLFDIVVVIVFVREIKLCLRESTARFNGVNKVLRGVAPRTLVGYRRSSCVYGIATKDSGWV